MSTISSAIYDEFRAINLQRLDLISRCILRLDEEPGAPGVAEELCRALHTLKGEARMLSLHILADLMHALEDLVQWCRARRFAHKEGLDLALHALDLVSELVGTAVDPAADSPLVARACSLAVTIAARMGEVDRDPGAAAIGALRAGLAAALPTLHGLLDRLDVNLADAEAGAQLPARLGALKDEARGLGLDAVALHLWSIENEAREATSDAEMMFGDLRLVRAGLGVLSAALDEAQTEAARAEALATFNQKIAFTPPAEPAPAPAQTPTEKVVAVVLGRPPADEPPAVAAELIDTFQASSVLRVEALSRCLLHLEDQPQDVAVADELLREAHTLKGDARVVGLMELGHLVHRFEDLLIDAKKGGFTSRAHFDLALSGVDLIARVLAADLLAPTPPGVGAAIGAYLVSIEGLLRGAGAAAPRAGAAPAPAGPARVVSGPVVSAAVVSAAVVSAPLSAAAPSAAAPVSPPAPADEGKRGEGKRRELLHIPVEQVEDLIHLAGELTLWQTQQDRLVADIRRIMMDFRSSINRFRDDKRIDAEVAERFGALARELGVRVQALRDDGFQNALRLTELQDSVSGMQLVEVRSVFGKYPRAVRAMSRDLGKDCAVELEGEDVAVDKKVLMQIEDALLHLVRNSVDHGIEKPELRVARGKPARGTLRLAARNKGAFVEVEIADDGGGIDAEKIAARLVSKGLASADEVQAMSHDQLIGQIFRPGFSTVEVVTDISGRGVGMDVVKRQIDAMGGAVRTMTKVGVGTTFLLTLPVSASVTQAMVFRQDAGLFAIPSALIESMLHVLPSAVQRMGSQALLRHDNDLLGLHDLDGVLGFGGRAPDEPFWRVVVVRLGERRVALRVRAVLGERKLVQQASDPFLAGLAVLSGTARIEGGELVSVLNVSHLLRQVEAGGAGISAAPLRSAAAEPVPSVGAAAAPTRGGAQTVLVVEDSDITRRMLVAAVGRLGYQTVEAVNGREGLDKFEAHSPDLVLTDLDMPVMTGIELLRALRQRGSQCPCVVMTSRESEESKAEALAAGANAYLLKSAHSDARLKDALAMMLGARAEAAA
ncbi:MAG: hypothetical protein RL071_3451 [Pseudomonadota bacterium]